MTPQIKFFLVAVIPWIVLLSLVFILRRRKREVEGDALVKLAGREIRNIGVFGFFVVSLSSYSLLTFGNKVKAERGEAAVSFFSFESPATVVIPLLLFCLFIIVLGECIKRKKMWAYRVSLYMGYIFSLLFLLWALIFIFRGEPLGIILPLLFLASSLYFLYRLTRPKVREQFRRIEKEA